MKLGGLKEYIRKASAPNIGEVDAYLRGELMATLRELRAVFNRITFEDNWESFITTVTIPASSELGIPNKIGRPLKYWMVLRKDEGGIYLCDGDNPWTAKTLYLKNTSGATDATATIVFFN
jgi:hypothetical protein